ncbi:MAG: VCBS repeat-containing protein, partial [Microcoleus sp. PH2017_22_RUC_O_B]|uniref:FG-GAP-like repeat-containing protein n=1 Tax=unclassified Microcoleus TaxID=2642155 RepID=UPI001DE2BB3D|nr:VCBS repeat-containing protein [Microcoleus sp. PH2017_21_RUC_O_A]MCC3539141.1 VCBS repeat-containing protein [Microcoleus sp. PH2017_22_RUC_O_B]
MVLNNSEFFPTLLSEAVDFAKNYNVENPPIGGAVNSLLQADKLLEIFQFSDSKEAGAIASQTSIDNFLISDWQGYVTPLPEITPSQEDADFLTGIKQKVDTFFPNSEIVGEHSDESDGLIAGVGDKFNRVPPPSTNSPFQSAFTPATINVTYNGVPDEAKPAFQYAVNIWKNLIYSPVPINIQVDWVSLNPGILGQGKPSGYQQNFANAPQPNTLYAIGLANSLAGIDLDTTKPDLDLKFNSSRADWYFGTDRNTPSGKFDFVSVAMHEIAHGLGINGQMQSNGGVGQWGSLPAIFDRNPVNASGQSLINTSIFPNPSTALGNQLIGNTLLFNGANARNANGNNNPRLYAPNPWNGGSSFYHLDENAYHSDLNSLMTPFLNSAEAIHDPGPVTLGLLKDLGWAVNTSPSFNRVKTFGDFNGDGKADIFWRDPVSGNNAMWLSNGANFIDASLSPAVATGWKIQGTGDFNGDGKSDIFWRDNVGQNVVWFMNGANKTDGV